MELKDAMLKVEYELKDARRTFPSFNSYHEGYAVIKEELDELWEVIKSKDRNAVDIEEEAKQIAAMGIRFMCDLCDLGYIHSDPVVRETERKRKEKM